MLISGMSDFKNWNVVPNDRNGAHTGHHGVGGMAGPGAEGPLCQPREADFFYRYGRRLRSIKSGRFARAVADLR
jgi:hypothetical protein